MSPFIRRSVGALLFLPLILSGLCIPAQAAAEKKDIVVNVHDFADNAPLSGVKITLQVGNSQGDGYSADDGSAHIKVSTANSSYAYLSASSEGLCPVRISWPQTGASISFPDHIDIVMERAAGISGIIADQDGKPLPGALVICTITKKYPNPLEQLSTSWRPITADSDGKWSLADVPETFDTAAIGAYDKNCIDNQSFIQPKPFADIAGLKNGTAIYKLQRGTPVQFIIHGPEGQPVRIARVAIGNQRGGSNAYPEEKADGDGIVTLGVAPGSSQIFTITAKGFAPELIRESIGTTPKTFNVKLTAGNLLEGTIVDGSGDPVANGQVSVQTWRGTQVLQPRIRADSDGKFTWTDAPPDDLIVSVYTELGQKDNVTVRAGKENKIQLTPPASFKGTVVDAATNKPVTDYKIVYGMKWSIDQPVNWQFGNEGGAEITQDGNTFEATFRQNYPWIAMRVTADGYLPEDSDAVAEGKDGAFTFKLEKGTPIKGIVVNADGSPVKEATIILVLPGNNIQVENGSLPEWTLRQVISVSTGVDGSFSFSPQRDNYELAVLTDAGCADVSRADFQKDSTIKLTPWAKIEGTVRRGTKPDAGIQVAGWASRNYQQNQPNIQWSVNTVADANGNFTINRVNAGTFTVGRQLQLGNNSTANVNTVTITIAPGETSKIQIGGVGRPIVGHITITPEIAAKGFAFFQSYLRQNTTATPWQPPAEVMAMNNEDRAAWYKNFLESPEGKKIVEEEQKIALHQQNFMFMPKPDGSFQIDDVPEGSYTITSQLADLSSPNQYQPGKPIGMVNATVTVPPVPGGVSDDPLDVGSLSVSTVASAGAGAPDFAVKTIGGADWNVSGQKGKIVLLYFWSALYSPSPDTLTPLKDVWDAFGKNPKFTMMGVSMADNTGEPTKKFAAAHDLTWPIAAVGRDRQSLIQEYPMHQIPTYWLIDVEGRIVGENLAKEQLKSLIENALKANP